LKGQADPVNQRSDKWSSTVRSKQLNMFNCPSDLLHAR